MKRQRFHTFGTRSVILLLVMLSASFRLSAQELTLDSTSAMAWSPAGDRLAIAVYDGTIEIWDAKMDERLLRVGEHTAYVSQLAWSPDSTRLATSGEDYIVHIWDTASGRLVAILPNHRQQITALAWLSSDQLATGTDGIDFDAALRLWDGETGALLKDGGEISTCALNESPDHRLLAAICISRLLLIDPVSLAVVDTFDVRETRIASALAWSPNSDRIVIGYLNGVVKFWDVQTGDIISSLLVSDDTPAQPYERDPDSIIALAFSSDGTRLMTLHYNGTLRMWNVETGKVLERSMLESSITHAVFSPDGEYIAYSTPSIRYRVVSLSS